MGYMMTEDDIALSRAVGPDQADPPGGSLPRGPFPGLGFPAEPLGGRGGHGPPGGGGLGHHNGGARQPSDKLVGNPLEVFMGVQAKAEPFLTSWGLYVGINITNLVIVNAYQKSMLFLMYIQGSAVLEWVQAMSNWLQCQVVQEGVDTEDIWLWNSTRQSFCHQYADTLQQEKAQATIMRGLRMDPQNINGYIAQFEELICHTGYNINNPLTIGHFTKDSQGNSTRESINLIAPQPLSSGGLQL